MVALQGNCYRCLRSTVEHNTNRIYIGSYTWLLWLSSCSYIHTCMQIIGKSMGKSKIIFGIYGKTPGEVSSYIWYLIKLS